MSDLQLNKKVRFSVKQLKRKNGRSVWRANITGTGGVYIVRTLDRKYALSLMTYETVQMLAPKVETFEQVKEQAREYLHALGTARALGGNLEDSPEF